MIETDRLVLRPHGLGDLEAAFALSADPAVMRFISGRPGTRQEAWERLQRYVGHWSLLGFGMFAVFERDGGAFVGEVGLAQFGRGLGERFDAVPEAGWMLARSAHGKGYAREAAEAAHAWLAGRRSDGRTVCLISPENAASLSVARGLGYAPFAEAVYREKPVILLERGAA